MGTHIEWASITTLGLLSPADLVDLDVNGNPDGQYALSAEGVVIYGHAEQIRAALVAALASLDEMEATPATDAVDAGEEVVVCSKCHHLLEPNGDTWVSVMSGDFGGTFDWCAEGAEADTPHMPLRSGVVRVEIENRYADGHQSTATVHLPVVHVPEGTDDVAMANWWEDHVFPEVGDGHGRLNPYLTSTHKARISAAPVAALVGLEREW